MSDHAVGILVQEPNHILIRWIKVTTFVYFTYYAYLFSGYFTTGVESNVVWLVTVLCMYVVVIWLPVYGIKAVRNSDARALSAFSGMQSCLCLWHFMQLAFLMVTVGVTKDVCQGCQASFDAGNVTCYIQSELKTLQINVRSCQQPIPNLNQLLVSFFYVAMALSNCLCMLYARKTNSVKYVTASNIIQQVPELLYSSSSKSTTAPVPIAPIPTVSIPTAPIQVSELLYSGSSENSDSPTDSPVDSVLSTV